MNNKWKRIIGLCITALILSVFLLLFSSTTSPLFDNIYGFDSAYYRFIGLSMLNSKTPYLDIWENKGPVLYFIQMLGAVNGTQNRKISFIFLMQTAALFAAVFFLEGIDQKINGNDDRRSLKFILLTIFALPVIALNLEGGNLTEDWSLPMISCSLYFFVKFALRYDKTEYRCLPTVPHPRHYAFIHGICFALTAFIRVNNTISICGGLLAIGIILIISRQWKNLAENILFGIMGITTAALPAFGWYMSKHALSEMLYAIFGHSLKYAGKFAHTEYSKTEFISLYLPLIVCVILISIHYFRIKKLFPVDIIALSIVISNFLLLLSHNTCRHYFVIVFPVYLFILILYVKAPNLPEILITVIVFISTIPGCCSVLSGSFTENERPVFSDAKLYIPKDERSSMIAFDVTPEVYLIKGMMPCSRFAAYQSRLFEIEPEFNEEFISDVKQEKPIWIIKYCWNLDSQPELQKLIDSDYSLSFTESNYCFYRRTDGNL